ncbi:MAG: HAD-IB family phosphatase [Parcubacteria group bacterium]
MQKHLICDFDSTIVSIETLDELAKFVMRRTGYDVDLAQKIEEITEMGMQGEISFAQSLSQRLALMHLHRDDITAFKDHVMRAVTVSVLKNRDFLKKYHKNIHIISGGFYDFIIPVATELGIDAQNVHANSFAFDDRGEVIGYDVNSCLVKPSGKALQVKQLQLGGKVIMVGDGWTDYEVKQSGAADHFVAFVEHMMRDKVMDVADHVAHGFDDVVKYYKSV